MSYTWSEETVQLRDKKTRSPGFFKDPSTAKASEKVVMPDSLPGRSISARIFPNGEFGVGFVPQRGISAKDRKYDADCRYAEENAEIQLKIELDDENNIIFYGREKVLATPPPNLGIGTKSSQRPSQYGLKGITGYGRKMVRNAGTLMSKAIEGKYNRKLCMGTLTVPSYLPRTMKAICSNWGDIQRKFFQEVKRRYERFRYQFDYVSVTEIQPKRLESRGEVGLHIHFLFTAIRYGRGKWVLPHSWVREAWGRILAHYVEWGECPREPNYRCDVVNTSASAYLSKYMSKGGDDIRAVLEEFGECYLPRQWWSISSRLRSAIKYYTIRSQGSDAEKLLVISRWGVSDYIRYIRCISLPVQANDYAKAHGCPQEIVLGYGGLLTHSGFQLFTPRDYFASIQSVLPDTLGRKHRHFKKCHSTRLTTQG